MYQKGAMELSRQQDVTPTDFTNPCLHCLAKRFFGLDCQGLDSLWGEGEQNWSNMYVGFYLYEPWHSGPPAILGASLSAQCPGIAFSPSVSVVGPAISTTGKRISSSRPGQQWTFLPSTGVTHIVLTTCGNGR